MKSDLTGPTREEIEQRNAQKKEERSKALSVLKTQSGYSMMADLAENGGSMGRRIAREIRRSQATGRVSSWLAGQTLKEELKRQVPSTAVDNFIKNGVTPTQLNPPPPPNQQPNSKLQSYSTYDLLICENGVTKVLKVLTAGAPQII